MKQDEFKQALSTRREELGLSYAEIQRTTQLGYNTVRRVFRDPMHCQTISLMKVMTAMGGEMIFSVDKGVGDDIEDIGVGTVPTEVS